MKIATTGGYGFLGWHTARRLRALDSGSIIMTGLDVDDVVRGVGMAIADGPVTSSHPAGYEINDTSNRVVRFISSTAGRHNQWAGVRRG